MALTAFPPAQNLSEFAIIWATFICIAGTNLEIGIGAGLGVSVLLFVLQYSRISNTRRVMRRSNIMRGFPQRTVLGQHEGRIIARQLSGFIFFGSALGITKEIKAALGVTPPVAHKRKKSERKRLLLEQAERLQARGRMYVVLDLKDVAGVDSTAVRSCFMSLAQLMSQ